MAGPGEGRAIVLADLDDPAVVALLGDHVAQLRASSRPESTHVLDLDGLRAPDVRVWVAREHDEVVGCVALKRLDAHHEELKSMRTASTRLRSGIGTALLEHALDQARAAGATRVSLETGAQELFAPARRLYARHGFTVCGPFGDYRPDPHSVFMTRAV